MGRRAKHSEADICCRLAMSLNDGRVGRAVAFLRADLARQQAQCAVLEEAIAQLEKAQRTRKILDSAEAAQPTLVEPDAEEN